MVIHYWAQWDNPEDARQRATSWIGEEGGVEAFCQAFCGTRFAAQGYDVWKTRACNLAQVADLFGPDAGGAVGIIARNRLEQVGELSADDLKALEAFAAATEGKKPDPTGLRTTLGQ